MLDLSEDQELLREASRRFIEEKCPLSTVRENVDAARPAADDYLRQAGDIGWFAMLVPEELGGGSVSGNPVLDAAVVAVERGRGLQPGPFVPMNVVADTLSRQGSPDQHKDVLPLVLSGEGVATWAVAGVDGDWTGDSGVFAREGGRGWILDGSKGLVQDVGSAAWVLLTAGTAQGPTQFLVPTDTAAVEARQLQSFDLTRNFGEIRFDGAELRPTAVVGEVGGAAGAYPRQLALAVALTVLEAAAAVERLFGMTLEYSKDRTAFGRPIGSFQALKHMIAHTSMTLEAIKGTAESVAESLDSDSAASDEVAAIAKAFVSEQSVLVAENCWQVFGGIAYTWEHDFHLFLRRINTDAELYGGAAWHRERICQMNEL